MSIYRIIPSYNFIQLYYWSSQIRTANSVSLWVLIASAAATVMVSTVIVPILNLMEEGLGANPISARLIVTIPAICSALCIPLCGILIDKFGAKKPFVIGLLIYGLSGGSGLLITDYWLMIVSRVMLGIGNAAIIPSVIVMILHLYEGQQRNTVMGWRSSGQSFGAAMWPLLGGLLGIFSWHAPFAIYLLGVPLSILAYLIIPDTHRGATQSANIPDNKESVLGLIRKTPILFIIYGLGFMMTVFLFAMIIFLPKVVEQLGVINPFHIGIFISVLWLTCAIIASVYGRIKNRLSYKSLVVIILFLWVVGFGTMYMANAIWLVVLSAVLVGLCQGITLPTLTLWAGEIVPKAFFGRITSYIMFLTLLGQFVSPLILSPIESSLGLYSVFLVIAGFSALLLVAFLVFSRGRIKS